jgi:hypothetical protein
MLVRSHQTGRLYWRADRFGSIALGLPVKRPGGAVPVVPYGKS